MDQSGILRLIYDAHLFLEQIESTARDYGTGDMLYSSDIHTIVAVSNKPGCSLTGLAASLNVSKAAVSKFVKKLLKLNYLNKENSAGHGKLLSFTLTEKGRQAAKGHSVFEKKAFAPLVRVIESLRPEEKKTITSFLQKLKEVTKDRNFKLV